MPLIAALILLSSMVSPTSAAQVTSNSDIVRVVLSEPEILGNIQFDSLAELVANSDVVVVATKQVGSRRADSTKGRHETTSKVIVHEVLKGPLAKYNTITLVEPGGVFAQRDGPTLVHDYPPGFQNVTEGISLLFLTHASDRYGYQLTGGPQGAYSVVGGHLVATAKSRSLVLWRTLEGRSLIDVKKAILHDDPLL
jgi:hypothetical protein